MVVPSSTKKRLLWRVLHTGSVDRPDGTLLASIGAKLHTALSAGLLEKFYFTPGQLGFPDFETRYARIGVYIC